MKLQELFEEDSTSKILGIVKSTLKDFHSDLEASEHNADNASLGVTGRWITIRIGDQSCSFSIKQSGLLELADMYVPKELRNKGFLTAVLKKIRHLPGVNGECKIQLAMNGEGWNTILKRAGFTRVKA